MAIDGVTSFRKTDDEDCPPFPSVLTVHPRGRTCSPSLTSSGKCPSGGSPKTHGATVPRADPSPREIGER